MNKITLVTGIWDIGRGNLSEGWSRPLQHYLDKFNELLDVEENMIIFGDNTLKDFVFKKRNTTNTLFIERNLSWFIESEFYTPIQNIRTNPEWFNQAGWLKESTQAKLENYNPLVMGKMFLLHDAKIMDQFNSDYMFWIDGGITNTIHPGYFTKDKVLNNLTKYINKFSFVAFPYEADKEIHGFDYNKINEICRDKVNKVCRGGFFGGPVESISKINSLYYELLKSTLNEGYMGTEESIFTILSYTFPTLVNYFLIESNGLLGTFFENLKNDKLIPLSESKTIEENYLDTSKTALYVISFNSPNQFESLIKSMLEYDVDFISKPTKFLLDNSTDLSTTERYLELCNDYGFEHIKKDNIGICGGRQWVAEHFDNSDFDFMWFSEDDMFFQNNPSGKCKNGYARHHPNLYSKTLNIVKSENFDFLKINYTEFYGDNGTQWAWYNLSQDKREEYFPEKPNLPVHGHDPNSPLTKFNNIKSYNGLPYVDGEIYYCNWTQVVSKPGNKKMFINTKFKHPFENTWMSFMYQLTKANKLKSGVLLLTPIEHNRFEFYDAELRKECI